MSGRRGLWACLAVFVLAGFLLRAGLAAVWPTLHRPDEVFQNLEPAHRLLTGWGVVSWEWRDGIRSWLFPDFLYAIMWVAQGLHLPGRATLPLIWAVLSLAACGTIAIGVVLGWRRFGLAGAVLCGVLTAFWPDLVYFGPKTLGEVQAGNLLAVAAGLACLPRGGRGESWQMAVIGVLLGLAFALRFQLAPGLAVVGLWAGGRQVRRGWVPLLVGAAVPLAVLGIVDAVTWGSPFQSVWKNIVVNFAQNKADVYGREPFYWYGEQILRSNGAAALFLLGAFAIGAIEVPLLALTAVVIVLFHSLIAHKEISFIYAALPLAVITAGLGTARVVRQLPGWLRAPVRPGAAIGAAGVVWLLTMAFSAMAERPYLQTDTRAALQSLWADLRAAPDACGIGLYGEGKFPWTWSPGYVGLDRKVPLYLLRSPEEPAAARGAFNYVITEGEAARSFAGDQKLRCSWGYCLFHIAQQCQPAPAHEISAALKQSAE